MIIKTILWDFDGVILDSMSVRDFGFQEIFKDFTPQEIDKLISYHRLNGGLSRYVKIRYFFEHIIGRAVDEKEVVDYAKQFSKIMKQSLTNPKNIIQDSFEFIVENHHLYNFHVVSGSDQEELRFLCEELDLSSYFISIHGSPTAKTKLVKNLLSKHDYLKSQTCLIGDSINDYDAAMNNEISFFGYNNIDLKELNSSYISSFKLEASKLN